VSMTAWSATNLGLIFALTDQFGIGWLKSGDCSSRCLWSVARFCKSAVLYRTEGEENPICQQRFVMVYV
jgi:hypothetical protein